MKVLVIKKMLAALCALSVIGSSVSVVGAIRENNSNVVNSANDCDTQIEELQQAKNEVIQERDGKLRELDAAISSDRRKLRAANNLIREGHNEFKNKRNRLERYIKINENEKIRLLKACAQEISEIDGHIEELKKQKSELGKKSSNRAVFDNIMKEFENSIKYEPKIQPFQDWEKLRKIDSNSNNIFEKVETNIQNDIFSSFGPANKIDLFESFGIVRDNNNQDDAIEDNAINNPENPLLKTSLFGSIMDIKGSNDENNNNNLKKPKTTLQQISNAFGFEKINDEFEIAKNKLNAKVAKLKTIEQDNIDITTSNVYQKEIADLKKQIDEAQKCLDEVSGKNVGIEKMKEFIDTSRRGCLAVDKLKTFYIIIAQINGNKEKMGENVELFKQKLSEVKRKMPMLKEWVKVKKLNNSKGCKRIIDKIEELDKFKADECNSFALLNENVKLLAEFKEQIEDLHGILQDDIKTIFLECKESFKKFVKWASSKNISVDTSEEYRDIMMKIADLRVLVASYAVKEETKYGINAKILDKAVSTGNELISKMTKVREDYANNGGKILRRKDKDNDGFKRETTRAKKIAKEMLIGQTQWKTLTEKVEQKGNLQYDLLQNMINNNKRKIAGMRKSNEGQRREAARAKRIAAMTIDAQNKFRHLSKGIEQKKIDNDLKEVLKKNEQIKKNQNNNNQNTNEFSLFNNDNIENNQNDANNKKITLNDFRSLLAGHQIKDNIRTVKGKKVNVWNTCGIFMMTTLKNIYDSIDGKNSKIQGFNNVIDNYEKSGADTSLLYSTVTDPTNYSEGENVGRVFSSDDLKSFLEKNNIGMYKLNIDQVVFINDQTKNPLDVVKPYKDKMIGKVKEFLVSYMKGKNFAPVGVLSGGHWNLLAQYDEANQKVVKLDSLPDEAVMLDIDKAAENCVNVVNDKDNMWTVTCELPIFTRGGEFKTKTFTEIDDFTHDALKGVLQDIKNMK